MKKQAIAKALQEHVEGACFVTKADIARFLKESPNTINDIVDRLDWIPAGEKKERQRKGKPWPKYFVEDVAESIVNNRRIPG